MDLLFLGTGAAEAIPSAFCRCDYCVRVRRQGGKDVRSRSSFRIDGRHQIDMSPDISQQMIRWGLDLFDLEHLLITHSHEDHFDLAELVTRECAVPVSRKPLYLYMNKRAAAWARNLLTAYAPAGGSEAVDRLLDVYRLVPVEYFETFAAGDLTVTALKANHTAFGEGEYGHNYILELPDGRRLLYALDTGWYGDETWEFLRGRSMDIVIMDCTFGGRQDRSVHPGGHLDVRSFLLMLEKMQVLGCVDGATRIFANHINHKHHLFHEDMQRAFDQSGFAVTVAWDGLAIE